MGFLRDFIYYDEAKASSILSQFDWGLIQEMDISQSTHKKRGGLLGLLPGIAKAEVQLQNEKTNQIVQKRKLYHDLFNRTVQFLRSSNLITYLAEEASTITAVDPIPEILELLDKKPFIEAEGAIVIEDYSSLPNLLSKLNTLLRFIPEWSQSSPEFEELRERIEEEKKSIQNIKDPNVQARAKSRLRGYQNQVLEADKKIRGTNQEIVDTLSTWVTLFANERIGLRVFPFASHPEFQLICNLKKDCFIDENFEHLLYGYGTRPTMNMTVFGLITSIPDPLYDQKSAEIIERGIGVGKVETLLHQMFQISNQLELQSNLQEYPKVIIQPIAIYREFPYQLEED